MSEIRWTFTDATARNAFVPSDGDVAAGYAARLLSTGLLYQAVKSIAGESAWEPIGESGIVAEVPIASGTWTPTPTYAGVATAVTISLAQYVRIGTSVLWAIRVSAVTYSGTGTADVRVTPPVPSNFGIGADVVGVGTADVGTVSVVRAMAETTNDLLQLIWTKSTDTNTHSLWVCGMYRVI